MYVCIMYILYICACVSNMYCIAKSSSMYGSHIIDSWLIHVLPLLGLWYLVVTVFLSCPVLSCMDRRCFD